MKRRVVLATAGAMAVLGKCAFAAQTRERTSRIGLLGDAPATFWDAYRDRLRELGYVEGENLALEFARAEGNYGMLPSLAQRLVRDGNDLIVAAGGTAALAAKQATRTIPIVMINGSDPVEMGLIDSLSRPGGNITGLSTVIVDLSPKRLELLREVFPNIGTIAALANATSANYSHSIADIKKAARALGIEIQLHDVRAPEDIEPAFAGIKASGIAAVVILPSTLFFGQRARLASAAAAQKLATMSADRELVEAGALMSYAPSYLAMYRAAADFVDRILKGSSPADMPVEQPTTFEFVLNLKTARELGIAIPQSLLTRADEVIE